MYPEVEGLGSEPGVSKDGHSTQADTLGIHGISTSALVIHNKVPQFNQTRFIQPFHSPSPTHGLLQFLFVVSNESPPAPLDIISWDRECCQQLKLNVQVILAVMRSLVKEMHAATKAEGVKLCSAASLDAA
eukprot:scaffold9463_cov140-Skeletonema_menzelii.AAC.8